MRILVYGAGVLGCELTHVLLQNKKNVVTLLARGEWKEMIDQKGLVIRHWAQRRTTTERVKTIDALAPDDFYDLVFVVVQAGQLPDVLPVLKANRSQYFVFVGNDPQAKQVLEAGVQAAEAGVEATKPMVATKGRASYLGERSIGHQDPGATSFTLMMKEIAKAY